MVAILITVGITVSPIAMAEWEGVSANDYWWPYNLYLAMLWILPIGYSLVRWLCDWWRTRRAIYQLGKRSP